MKDIKNIKTTKMHPKGYKAWVTVKKSETIQRDVIIDADGATEKEAIENLKKKYDTF